MAEIQLWADWDFAAAGRSLERAVEVCGRILELAPDQLMARECLLHAHLQLGRPRQARLQAVELMRRMGASETELAAVGDEPEIERALRTFWQWRYEWFEQRDVPPVAMATAALPLGRDDEVFEWLEKAYEHHSGNLVTLATDHRADAFREDPRFIDLLHRIGFPAEAIER